MKNSYAAPGGWHDKRISMAASKIGAKNQLLKGESRTQRFGFPVSVLLMNPTKDDHLFRSMNVSHRERLLKILATVTAG